MKDRLVKIQFAVFVSLSLFLTPALYAVDYNPLPAPRPMTMGQHRSIAMGQPSVSMQSVNNMSYMSAGSAYSSDVFDVGSSAPSSAAPHKAPPGSGGGTSGYDPANPQFAPVGDAVLPLLLMALTYLLVRVRRKRQTTDN